MSKDYAAFPIPRTLATRMDTGVVPFASIYLSILKSFIYIDRFVWGSARLTFVKEALKLSGVLFLKTIDSWTQTGQPRMNAHAPASRLSDKMHSLWTLVTRGSNEDHTMEHKEKPARRKQVRWQDIHNKMTRKGWPAWMVNAKVDAFREHMQDLKREKLFAYHHRIYWAKLLRPLMYELDSARTGLRYARTLNADNPQKIKAIEAYVIVMEELAMRLTSHRDDKVQTPSQLAKAYNDEHKKRGKGFFVPNNGAHWTDWIPTHIKQRVASMFAFAPRAPRSKPRLPFQRTMPPSLQSDAILALRRRIDTELATAHSLQEIGATDIRAQKIEQMNRALHILDTMKRSAFVPTTWKALLEAHGEAPPFTGEEDETID